MTQGGQTGLAFQVDMEKIRLQFTPGTLRRTEDEWSLRDRLRSHKGRCPGRQCLPWSPTSYTWHSLGGVDDPLGDCRHAWILLVTELWDYYPELTFSERPTSRERKGCQEALYIPPLPSHLHFLEQGSCGWVTRQIPHVIAQVTTHPHPIMFVLSPIFSRSLRQQVFICCMPGPGLGIKDKIVGKTRQGPAIFWSYDWMGRGRQ